MSRLNEYDDAPRKKANKLLAERSVVNQSNIKPVDIEAPTATVDYVFPVTASTSVFFMARGNITKATLKTGNTLIGQLSGADIVEVGHRNCPEIPHGAVILDFFGGKPFHCALASNWKVVVTLSVAVNHASADLTHANPPDLIIAEALDGVTWESVKSNVYCEAVRVGKDRIEKTLMYTPDGCGYTRESGK